MGNFSLAPVLRELRRGKAVSQAAMADALNISMQAVSKWETGASCPDIALLPRIADYFGVSIDELFAREPPHADAGHRDLPDDGIFRVVQAVGRHILKAEQYNERKTVRLSLPDAPLPPVLEFRTPTIIAGDLVCASLRVDGDLCVRGEYLPAGKTPDQKE